MLRSDIQPNEPIAREQVALWLLDETLTEAYIFHRTPERGSFWQPITGGKKATDLRHESAAMRELEEETGLVLSEDRLVTGGLVFFFRNERGLHSEHTFAMKITEAEGRAIRLSDEHDAIQRVVLEELPRYIMYPENLVALDNALQAFAE